MTMFFQEESFFFEARIFGIPDSVRGSRKYISSDYIFDANRSIRGYLREYTPPARKMHCIRGRYLI